MIVAVLWVIGALNYLDRGMITTMRGSIQSAIPMTEAQFGLLTTVFLLVYAALGPVTGFLADRFGRSRVILFSLLAWSFTTWLTAQARTFEELLACRALMGITEASYVPAALALIADYHGGRTRSFANGVHLTGVMVGSAFGGIGGWLAERHGWAYAFELFGIVGVGYAVVVIVFLRDRKPGFVGVDAAAPAMVPDRIKLGAAFRSLFSRAAFVLAALYWGLLGLASWAVIGWMPTYLKEQFHLTQGAAGLSATMYLQGSSLVGVLVGGLWADRWSLSRPLAPVWVPMIGLCAAAPGIFVAANTVHLPSAISALMVYGLAMGVAFTNMMPILTLVTDVRYRATGYGVLNLLSCAVGGAAIYLGGALRDLHVDVGEIFRFGALSLLVCALLLWLILIHAGEKSDPEVAHGLHESHGNRNGSRWA